MTYGLSQAGIKILRGIDIDEQFRKTYELNNPDSEFLNWDVTQTQPEHLQDELNLKRFDDSLIFIGCSPCQYWSRVNTDRFSSSYTKNLLEDFQRFVNYFRPGYVLLENVPGIKKKRNNHVLLNFYDFLNLNGYVYDAKIVNTNRYGVPQTRHRFVLIATRNSLNISLPPEEKNEDLIVRNFLSPENGFPSIPHGHKDNSDFLHTSSNLSEKNLRRIKATPKDGGTRMAWKDDPELQLDVYKGKDDQFRNVYGRMFWDKPAPTITTRFNSYSNGRFGHPVEDRAISLREGATLQTFPKDYIFKGSINSIAKQIGNAVPPNLAKRLGIALIEHWNKCHISEQKQEQLTY